MKKGNIVKREYSVSNIQRYKDECFLKRLDSISKKEGLSILKRDINEKKGSVTITARFDSDHWDICGSLEFLSKNGITVKPLSDFESILEQDEKSEKLKITVKEIREMVKKVKKDLLTVT